MSNASNGLEAQMLEAMLTLGGIGSPANLTSLVTTVAQLATNPQVTEGLGKMFQAFELSSCHTASDVAQDALDCYDHGKMSAEAALKIVAIAVADEENRRANRMRRA